MPRVYVAAGSNVDPLRNLRRAVAELTREFGPLAVSPWYRNPAVGFAGDDFINFVFGFETELALGEVIRRLHAVEAQCGRPRQAPKWAPRTMDLDILLYGDLVSSAPGPSLPRPDLLLRPYMLGPLADLAPDLRHPVAGATIGELWRRFDRGTHPMHRVPVADGPGAAGAACAAAEPAAANAADPAPAATSGSGPRPPPAPAR